MKARVRAERESADTKKFEKMVSGFSSEFINLPVDSVDSKIENALKEIALFEGADRSYFFQFNPDRTEFTISHLWWISERTVSDQDIRGMVVDSRFPWLSQNLTSGQDVIVQDVICYPEEIIIVKNIQVFNDIFISNTFSTKADNLIKNR